MEVNHLLLPSYLVELINAGRWEKPENISLLSEMTGVERPEDFSFLLSDRMERETNSGYSIVNSGQGYIYGIYSGSDLNSTPQSNGFLDVTKSVIIAVNWDEEVICLDYCENPNEPSVVLSIYPPTSEGAVQWKVLAKSFREFAEKLNL
jgi:hypothetical protein